MNGMKKIVFLLMALFTISNVKAATDYAITFSNDETKGTAVANPERATPGETVTITVTPKRGYAVKDVTVDAGYEIQGGSGGARAPKKIGAKKIRQSQGTVEVTKNSDTEFTFTPPTELAGISFTYNNNTNFLVTITYEEVAILYPIVAADADTIKGCSSVTVNPEEQEIGKDVEITVVPENHYEVDKVWVTAIMEATEGEVPEEGDAKARKSPRKANLHIDYDVEIEATAVEGKENTYSFTLPETLSGGPLADDYNEGTKFIVHVKMNEIPIKYKFLAPVGPNAHGTCTVEPSEQYKGQDVTIKFIPDEGYELEGAVMIAYADYNAEPGPDLSTKAHQQFNITPDMVNADGTYVFTLPEKFQSGSYEEYTENTTFVIASVFTEKKYNIIADENVENGTIAVDPKRQKIGEKVTITLTPAAGYVVKEESVKVNARYPNTGGGSDDNPRVKPRKAPTVQYSGQGDITVTKVDDTTYEFTLPQTLPSTWVPEYHNDTEFFVTAEFEPAIVLYNDKANETTINNAPKNKPVNVKLAGRTIKAGVWSTICLPFPLTIEGSVLDGADVRKLVNSKLINNNRTVSLTFEKVSETEANYPYIIKVAEDITEPLFEGVTIPEEEVATGAEAEGLEKVWETPYAYMHGNYHPMSWKDETRDVLFLGTDGKFYYPDGVATTTVNSQRAFVTLMGCKIKGAKEDTTEPGDPEQGAGSDVKFYFNIDLDDTPTAITDINSDSEADGTWYDISGRPIKGKPATRGIYINNGHKFIIK